MDYFIIGSTRHAIRQRPQLKYNETVLKMLCVYVCVMASDARCLGADLVFVFIFPVLRYWCWLRIKLQNYYTENVARFLSHPSKCW